LFYLKLSLRFINCISIILIIKFIMKLWHVHIHIPYAHKIYPWSIFYLRLPHCWHFFEVWRHSFDVVRLILKGGVFLGEVRTGETQVIENQKPDWYRNPGFENSGFVHPFIGFLRSVWNSTIEFTLMLLMSGWPFFPSKFYLKTSCDIIFLTYIEKIKEGYLERLPPFVFLKGFRLIT